MRKMKWKQIAAMLVAVVMLCGAVGDWSFLVKAANTDISISWNGYWDAFVYDTSGTSKPDAAVQYCFDSIVVDDVEVKGTVLADLTPAAQFAIWESYWIGTSKPTKSVLIKAGTQLQEFDTSTWAVKEDGQTYTITNTMYLTSSDGGTTWNVTEYVEDTANKIALGFEAKYEGAWCFTVTNLPSDAATYYIADKVTIDGTESNSVKFTVSNGKILIEEWFDGSNKPTKSIVIPKDMTLREFSLDSWGAVSGGKTMVTANELKVVYDGATWKVENPVAADDVALRFVVVSDAHMETADDARGKRIAQMFEQAYAYAEQDETHPTLDAVVFNGDIVNYGKEAEYAAFKTVIDAAIDAEETELLTTMGNHEYWDQNVNDAEVNSAQLYQNGINAIDSIQQKDLNWSTTINGYSFIGMSPQVSEGSWDTYGTTTLNWMSEKVEEAVAADEEKPVFTFQHFAIGDTVYGTENGTGAPTGESDKLNAVYAGHNQVINFSGHTHAPINGPTSINQTTYTQYTTGTLYYLNMDASASYGAQPSGTDQTNEYTIVEVYRDNTVKMFPYDGKEGQFFKKLDGSGEQLVFEVDVNDSTNWLYTSTRAENENAPAFASTATITTDKITYKSAQITFPQATDDSGVYAYDITCTPTSGATKTYRIFSEWYFSNMPETLTYVMAGLDAGTNYTVSVVPVDFFGKKGTAITTTITTITADAAEFSLSLASYQEKDLLFQLVPSNMDYVAGTYYKIPVTVDGTTDAYIVASKQASGYLAVWLPSYLQVYNKTLTVNSSIEIKSGAVLQEVSPSDWAVLAGGDSITVTEGVTLTKNAEGLYQQTNETTLSRNNTSPWDQGTYLQLLLDSSFNTLVTTYGWGNFESTILIDGKETPVTWAVNGEGSIVAGDYTHKIPSSATSIVIPAGTVLTHATSTSGPLVVKAQYALYKVNGVWTECNETILSKNNTSPWDQGTYLQVLLESSFDTIVTTYGWGNFESTILIDGQETPVTWGVNAEGSIVAGDYTHKIPSSATSIVIPAGTILTHSTSTKGPMIVKEELSLVKKAGRWYNADELPTMSSTTAIYSAVQTSGNQIEFYTKGEFGTTLTSWTSAEITITIDGAEKAVTLNLAPYVSDRATRYFWLQGSNIEDAITNGSKIEIPSSIEAGFNTEIVTFNFAENMTIDKLGQGWGMYTKIYEYPNGNRFYYNIDNGTTYKLTSSNNAIEVKGQETLTTGDELSTVGAYYISRIEDETLFNQIVVLYKHGDANEDGEYNSKDLVAAKLAQAGDEEQNNRLAGTYAADIDRSGTVEDVDLLALRRALVSEDAATTLAVSKGNSVLNGVMPIVGYGISTNSSLNADTLYDYIAELGINTISFSSNEYSGGSDREAAVKQDLQLAEQKGIKLYVRDDHLLKGYNSTDEQIAGMPSRVGEYSMYQSFLGMYIADEPQTSDHNDGTENNMISDYQNYIDLLRDSANLNGYLNLLPYYEKTFDSEAEYKTYLDATFNTAKLDMLSYDNYVFGVDKRWTRPTGSTVTTSYTKTTKYPDFYKNLEMARTKVEKTGKPFWVYAQAGSYPVDAPVDIEAKYLPTAAEQQLEISASLAMGAKGVQYFQVVQSKDWAEKTYDGNSYGYDYDRSGLIGADGQKNSTFYNAAKDTNKFVAAVDHVLMNAESKGVIANDATASGNLSASVKCSTYNELQEVEGNNAFVGCFDYFGKTALLVVNCDTSASQNIKLTFDKEHKLAVTKYDTTTELSQKSSTLEISVGAGQCTLVVVD